MNNRSEFLKWSNEKGHFQGIFWIILSCFFSNLADTMTRLTSALNLPAMQITFFRLFFGTIIILPILLWQGKASFIVKSKFAHLLRVVVGFGAIACWIYGVGQTSLPSITTISFVCPILVLPLAYLFLGERSDWYRILSVAIGFLGVLVIAFFEGSNHISLNSFSLHQGIMWLFLASILFALSDILNKKFISSETLLSMLFYFYLGTTLIAVIPALIVWQSVNYSELFYLFTLSVSGVLVLYCILKAAAAADISAISPYKYIELIFSVIAGYLVFGEVIKTSTLLGAALIIPSALLIAYHQVSKEKASKKSLA